MWRGCIVRDDDEVAEGMLPGAIHIPLDQLRNRIDELDAQAHWVIYCRSGHRSYFASQLLKGRGIEHVYNLKGGFVVQQLKGMTVPEPVTL